MNITAAMSQQMLAGLGGWATALGYSVNNSIGSASGDGFVGSGSSTPRLDSYRSTQALDVVGTLLSNPEGGYWSRSTGLVFFSEVSAAIFSGTPENRFETLRGFHYTDGTEYYLGDNGTSQGGDWLGTANNYSGIVSTVITAGIETTNAFIRNQFKSATTWTGWTNLRNSQQAWRTANVLGKTGAITLKITGAIGGVLGSLSASYSTYKVVNQAYNGGLQSVDGWDAADATFGWAGTASAAALILGTSNPIGWAATGIVAAGYGTFRAGQYIYENY